MKKLITLLLVIAFITTMSFVGVGCKKEAVPAEEEVKEEAAPAEEEVAEEAPAEEAAEPVTIVVSSWRTEDKDKIDQVNQLYMDQHPNITIEYSPIKRDEYSNFEYGNS